MIFNKTLTFSIQCSERKFIQWLIDSVDDPKYINQIFDNNSKDLFGELSGYDFWIKKKNRLFYKSRFSPFELAFSLLIGRYDINDKQLVITLRSELSNKNILFGGVIIWTLITIFLNITKGITYLNSSVIAYWVFVIFAIWRTKSDLHLIQKLIINELRKES